MNPSPKSCLEKQATAEGQGTGGSPNLSVMTVWPEPEPKLALSVSIVHRTMRTICQGLGWQAREQWALQPAGEERQHVHTSLT